MSSKVFTCVVFFCALGTATAYAQPATGGGMGAGTAGGMGAGAAGGRVPGSLPPGLANRTTLPPGLADKPTLPGGLTGTEPTTPAPTPPTAPAP